METKNRLGELLTSRKIKKEEFAKEIGISESTLKSYQNGNREIPAHIAIKIGEKYNVTLDWLYGVNNFFDEHDVMADIILALDKVFKFTTRKDQFSVSQPVLLVNRKFYNYICEIQKLQRLQDDPISYSLVRQKIYSNYKEYFREIWEIDGFDENQAVEIRDYEGITIVDLLSGAIENTKTLRNNK